MKDNYQLIYNQAWAYQLIRDVKMRINDACIEFFFLLNKKCWQSLIVISLIMIKKD